MRIIPAHHQHGDTICRIDFPDEHASIEAILGQLQPALYEVGSFTTTGRPLAPKRHVRLIGGVSAPALLPVDQTGMNRLLQAAFREASWDKEPVAAGPMAGPDVPLHLRGDFVRNRVFVEVEFGNVASMHRDFFKFQIANRSGAGDVGVLIVATARFAAFFDTNVATFESALRNRPYLAIGVQMPIWIVGIEPEDFDSALRSTYEEMHDLCSKNGLACHQFEAVLGAPAEPDESGDADVTLG